MTNRHPKEEYKRDIEMKRMIHDERMKSEDENEEELYRDKFENTWKTLKKTKK